MAQSNMFQGVNPNAESGHSKAQMRKPVTTCGATTSERRNGMITIFNRSHYEDVLIARVRQLVSEKVWRQRYHN